MRTNQACLPAAFLLSHSLLLAAGGTRDIEAASTALAQDDQCEAADEQCALSARQLRGQRLQAGSMLGVEEADEDEKAGRPTRSAKSLDLTQEQAEKLKAQIANVSDNCTALEWKLYYIELDVASTNASLFGIKNATIGVNGTVVNWMAHPVDWVPTFSLLAGSVREIAEPVEYLEPPSVAFLEESEGRPTNEASAPPRERKIQAYMTQTQHRLDKIWKTVTIVERLIVWQENYMVSHRRLLNGKPVLLEHDGAVASDPTKADEEAASTSPDATAPTALPAAPPPVALEPASGDEEESPTPKPNSKTHKHHKTDEDTPTDADLTPEERIEEQILSARNQTGDIWEGIGKLERQLEALKRRVEKYVKAGTPAKSLLQDDNSPQTDDSDVNDADDGDVLSAVGSVSGQHTRAATPGEDEDLRPLGGVDPYDGTVNFLSKGEVAA